MDAAPRQSPGSSFVDEILEAYEVRNPTFDVVIPVPNKEDETRALSLKLRSFSRYAELKEYEEQCADFMRKVPLARHPDAKGHLLEDVLPLNVHEQIAAFTLSYLSVEPKLTHRDALRLCKAEFVVHEVMSRFEKNRRGPADEAFAAMVAKAKKNLSEELETESSELG